MIAVQLMAALVLLVLVAVAVCFRDLRRLHRASFVALKGCFVFNDLSIDSYGVSALSTR
ncbi:hypothetical protein MITS9509_01922 [Synechococcus sp. MIT S9509]|uniref:hypothetical protein n=1 Tax=unclassified Synechococcus TaxID=2626047 RepID=UPI0007BC6424|nr:MULTISPECIES: hypothetical protein [unclassified Synechococcus]KZR85938.1 hypothetical protein MITS9504_01721 [Synechococcus sp. MIT S9504]KZR92001.1 hypothetical protein MITS9509_01922 [Synechococcus sp. MIT S9509]